MFIGQRLGGQIPYTTLYFRDAQSNITATARFDNQSVVRSRNVDPELIRVVANCEAVAIVNMYYGRSSISATANLSAVVQRIRQVENNIIVDANVDVEGLRERNVETNIDATGAVAANGERTLLGAAGINAQANVDTIAIRLRNTSADIDAEAIVEAIGGIVAALFQYSGDFAPGEVIEIDTDELTVEDGSGNNLRQYFDGDWYQIDPDTTDNLVWKDSEGSRDIEIVIEKEDRSI